MDISGGGIAFFEDVENNDNWVYSLSPAETMRLVHLLKAGDEEVVDCARALLARIPLSSGPEYAWKYSAFRISECFHKIIQKTDAPVDDIEMARVMCGESIDEVCERLCALLRKVCEYQRQSNLIAYENKAKEIAAFIESRCVDSAFDLNQMAEYCCMTPPATSRILKEILGENFKTYLRTLRLNKAKALLIESELSISEIAERVGFAAQSYFIQVFKSSLGITPAAYRESERKKIDDEDTQM